MFSSEVTWEVMIAEERGGGKAEQNEHCFTNDGHQTPVSEGSSEKTTRQARNTGRVRKGTGRKRKQKKKKGGGGGESKRSRLSIASPTTGIKCQFPKRSGKRTTSSDLQQSDSQRQLSMQRQGGMRLQRELWARGKGCDGAEGVPNFIHRFYSTDISAQLCGQNNVSQKTHQAGHSHD